MSLKIYHSHLSCKADEKLIKDLTSRDRNQSHIIITPDKKSLFYEKKLYSLIGEDAFFDVTTTTLSRFANRINGAGEKILTKQGGVLIVKKILNEHIEDLKSFGTDCDAVGFASVIYDTICMFKSSNVPPEKITDSKNSMLNGKLHDIKIVYEKYEEYLTNEYSDSFNRLSLCAKKITREDFKNTNIYFVGFDDFTKQAYYIIEKLLTCANSVNIAVAFAKKSEKKHNANIYTNAVFYSVIDLAKGKNCEILYENCECDFVVKEKKNILNEMFGYRMEKASGNNYVKLLGYISLDDEIKNTVQNIKYRIITENLRFKNFAIVVPSFSTYKSGLEKYLKEYDVNYFLDETVKLKETVVARYLIDTLSFTLRPNKYNALALLRNPFSCVDYNKTKEFEDYINYYCIKDYQLSKYDKDSQIHNILSKTNHFLTNSSGIMSIKTFIDIIKRYVFDETFTLGYEKLLAKYYENGDMYNYRNLKQSYEKLLNIFSEFDVIGGYECTLEEMLQFILLYMDNVTITIPPIVLDAVFVTEFSGAILDDVEHVFFLGVAEGNVPGYVTDAGLISDDEIDLMPEAMKISPSVNVINKRIKFNAFELLFSPKKSMTLSFPTHSDGVDCYASAIMENLKNIFSLKIENGSNVLDVTQNAICGDGFKSMVYNNFNKKTASRNFVELLKYWNVYGDNGEYLETINTLKKLVGGEEADKLTFKNLPNNINVKRLKTQIGISEIEKFCMCPYMHYCDYVLKLKESDSADMNGVTIGNILHEFLSEIVFHFDRDGAYALDVLDNILKDEEYKIFVDNNLNNYIIKGLREEVVRIFDVLKKQNSLSGFVPKYTELKFVSNKPVFENGENKVYLTGVIDRIDYSASGYRIIDYKTGKVDFKNYNGVVFGNKMQVVVYLSLFSDKNPHFKPLGALYLPISNDYSAASQEELYKMQGIIENSIDNMFNFDKNLTNFDYESHIVGLKTDKNGGIKNDAYYKNMCLSENQIKDLSEFVLDNIAKILSKISGGVITPNPVLVDEQCRFCKYLGMCNYNKNYGNSERGGIDYLKTDDFCGGEDND